MMIPKVDMTRQVANSLTTKRVLACHWFAHEFGDLRYSYICCCYAVLRGDCSEPAHSNPLPSQRDGRDRAMAAPSSANETPTEADTARYWQTPPGQYKLSETITNVMRQMNDLPNPGICIRILYDCILARLRHPPSFGAMESLMEHEGSRFYEDDDGWWYLTDAHKYSQSDWDDWVAGGNE